MNFDVDKEELVFERVRIAVCEFENAIHELSIAKSLARGYIREQSTDVQDKLKSLLFDILKGAL